jgi:hypothetical protein
MPDKILPDNVRENKSSLVKNGFQSALNYVQNAIERPAELTQDATQNLVNQVMKSRTEDEK